MIRTYTKLPAVGVALLTLLIGLVACDGTPATSTAPPAPPAVATVAQATAAATVDSRAAPTVAATVGSAPTDSTTAATTCKLNLNTLTEAQLLATIPNFSSRMVREFQEYKPYASILQFRQEIGKYVDAATIADYEKYVFVPIDPNASDAATLQQIPGVDATSAAALIAGRPYATQAAFVQALAAHNVMAATAGCYLAAQ